MSNSLRDQLLGLGYKPAPKPEPAPVERKPHVANVRPDSRGRPARGPRDERRPPPGKPDARQPQPGKPGDRRPPNAGARASSGNPRPARSREEMDLAKAYALRAQKEKDDRIEAERLKQEEAKKRREAKTKLAELFKDKSLNDPAAEIARHFNYGGKIKRVYVNLEQLKALNAGELGVAQMDGRYLLVPVALLIEAEAIFPAAVALKVDPDAVPGDDPYADPAFQVPDDLVW